MNDRGTHLMKIGQLFEELGLWPEAEEAYRKAMDADPEHPLIPLGRLACMLRDGMPEEDIEGMLELLEYTDCDSVDEGRAYYGLAHVADAAGEYERAAHYLRLAKQADAARAKMYSAERHTDAVTRTIESFTAERIEALSRYGHGSCSPIFVFGMPRSGTSLVEQILARHPLVHGAGELDFGLRSMPPPRILADMNADWIPRIADTHFDALERAARGKPYVVDKMPDNYLCLGWLKILFPNARFIEVCRNDADVALSLFFTDFKVLKWTQTPEHILARLNDCERIMNHWVQAFRPIEAVFYEDLVRNPEEAIPALVTQVAGLPWAEECMTPHLADRPVKTASLRQVRKPLYTTSVGRSLLYADYLPELFTGLEHESLAARPAQS